MKRRWKYTPIYFLNRFREPIRAAVYIRIAEVLLKLQSLQFEQNKQVNVQKKNILKC